MKKVLQILIIVGIVILVTVIIAAAYLFISPITVKHDGTAVKGSENWMSALPDDIKLSDIAIPGTHDSASNNVVLPYFAKCQDSDIRTQLDEGFRYLDIRLGVKRVQSEDKLLLYHGFCSCKESWVPWSKDLELSSVLAQCYSFLSDYPSETVIFVVKMEQGSDIKSFELLLDSYISKGQDKWLLTDTIPTLGQCRGKIVLFRRYDDVCSLGTRSGIEFKWEDQGDHRAAELGAAIAEEQIGFTLKVQDWFKYDAQDKWAIFEEGLAGAGSLDDTISLNFLSTNGSAKFGNPHTHAKTLNSLFLKKDLSEAKNAWIIVDYSSALLASHIYKLNLE